MGDVPAVAPPSLSARFTAAVGVAALVGCGAAVGIVAALGDGDNGTQAGADLGLGDEGEAAVAVTYGDATIAGHDVELRLAFERGDGTTIVERTWGGDLTPAVGDEEPELVAADGGLVQGVPVGDMALRATLVTDAGNATCIQPFTVTDGDRVILRLALRPSDVGDAGDVVPCAATQPVAEWVEGRTGPVGEAYVGADLSLARARALADGLTTRVVAVDGVDLAVTAGFVPDRLNLTLFDGEVVAAHLDGEGPL